VWSQVKVSRLQQALRSLWGTEKGSGISTTEDSRSAKRCEAVNLQ
jgi:hypothetical protein